MAVTMFACSSSSSSALLSPFVEIESRGRNAPDLPSRAAISFSRSSSSMSTSISSSSSWDCFSVRGVDYGFSSCASSSSSSSSSSLSLSPCSRDGAARRLSFTRSAPATASCVSGGMASRCAQVGWGASISLGVGLRSGLDWSRGRVLWRDEITSRKRVMRISAEKIDFLKIAGTALRLGKQGFEVGTNLIPESVPRPVARAGVALASTIVTSWILRSLFSTLTFVLAIGAVIFAAYVFLTKGESGSSDAASSDKPEDTNDALDAARKIMDKYK